MKTFDDFLDEGRIRVAARLVEENKFPLRQFIEWYVTEGIHLNPDELNQFMEGFWGDTWKGVAKGAGIGAGAGAGAGGVMGAGAGGIGALPGAGIGAGVGGLLGGLGGGLYGAGKHLWNRLRGQQEPEAQQAQPEAPKPDNVAMLSKMKTEYPQFSDMIDNMIKHLSGAKEDKPTVAKTEPQVQPPVDPRAKEPELTPGRNQQDLDNLHPAYKRRGVNPIGDHFIR